MPWLALLLLAAPCVARTLHVPADFLTIQSALDSVSNNDTILVALGTYAEALQARTRAFVLAGDVPSDTGDVPRPVIDPAVLPRSDTLCCLTIPFGADVRLRNLRFRNGPEMFPRTPPFMGGIYCNASSLDARYCDFDSTAGGIVTSRDHPARVTLSDCRFLRTTQSCVMLVGSAAECMLTASRCIFTCRDNGWTLIHAGSNSSITDCLFQADTTQQLLQLSGRNLLVSHCMFTDSYCSWIGVSISGDSANHCSAQVSNSMFDSIEVGETALLLESACDGVMQVANNAFQTIRDATSEFHGTIKVQCPGGPGTGNALLENNDFGRVIGHVQPTGRGVTLVASTTLRRNAFRDMGPDTLPAVWTADGRSVLTENNFLNIPAALCVYLPGPDSLDARENYWGDSTGPSDPVLNPEGRGARIVCSHAVQISPWLREPFAAVREPESHAVLPVSLTLAVYPNPFNLITKLVYSLDRPAPVKLTIVNVLGREVAVLEDDMHCAGSFTRSWDAAGQASGVYFAVLQAGTRQTVRKVLLMR